MTRLFPAAVSTGWLAVHSTTVTIDRIEGDLAVVEWSADHPGHLPLQLLPAGVAEGDRLELRWRHTRRPRSPTPPASSPLPQDLDLSQTPRSVVSPPPNDTPTCVSKEPAC